MPTQRNKRLLAIAWKITKKIAAPSILVILVGGITFLLCSFLAISQSNGKRVLAYSTIANLGLITACAGVGTAEAIWAAIFLVIFHAIAKTRLPLDCEIAINEHSKKVIPPTRMTRIEGAKETA